MLQHAADAHAPRTALATAAAANGTGAVGGVAGAAGGAAAAVQAAQRRRRARLPRPAQQQQQPCDSRAGGRRSRRLQRCGGSSRGVCWAACVPAAAAPLVRRAAGPAAVAHTDAAVQLQRRRREPWRVRAGACGAAGALAAAPGRQQAAASTAVSSCAPVRAAADACRSLETPAAAAAALAHRCLQAAPTRARACW